MKNYTDLVIDLFRVSQNDTAAKKLGTLFVILTLSIEGLSRLAAGLKAFSSAVGVEVGS